MIDWIEVNGASFRYAVDGQGPTLVLVHEIGGSLESWDEAVVGLKSRFRVVRYDQRGAGLSEKANELSFEQMLADLHAIVTALAPGEAVHLAGSALGAATALGFAARWPERTRSVAASSPAIGFSAAGAAKFEKRVQTVREGGMRASVDDSLAFSYPVSQRASSARFQRYRLRVLANDPESYIALNWVPWRMKLEDELDAIRCPVLVIGCAGDAIRPPPLSREVRDMIPGAEFAEVEGGHFLHVHAPELFVATVRPFLDRVEAQMDCEANA